jgi:hypothetical protein
VPPASPGLPLSSQFAATLLAGLHARRFAGHLRGATGLTIMLSCIDAAGEHQPCGMLSGEYSPVSRQTRFDP